jgi:subtilisin-like proprotein convertase family protein
MKNYRMRCLLLLTFGFFQFSLVAQVQLESGLALEEYVNEILLGNNGVASNITYMGGPSQLGYLTEGEEVFSFNSGLVMSSDVAEHMVCPGLLPPCFDCLGSGFEDPDLLAVANSVPELIGQSFTVSSVNDGCVLEFDFVAASEAITLEFVFGSDEYETFVNTPYNDVFAFFLSGPGVEGPYASPEDFPNGALNIAVIPDTDPSIPVTISSVNSSLNAEYFISNEENVGVCINGYTVPMLAQHPVICGETYHLKLAIADGSDTALESMVIIKDGTFSNAVQPAFDFSLTGLFVDNKLYEDCGLATLTIQRPEDTSYDEVVQLSYAGQATNGVDYGMPQADGSLLPLPDSVTFVPGQLSMSIDFAAAIDGVEEGPEDVSFHFEYSSICQSGFALDSISFDLEETPSTLEVTGFEGIICPGTPIEVAPSVSGGYGQYTFEWGCPEGSDENFITISPSEDWSCVVLVSDTCGVQSAAVELNVDVLEYPELTVSIDQEDLVLLDCNGSANLSATATGGDEDYTMYWTDGFGNILSTDTAALAITQGQNIDEVIVTVIDGCGYETDTISVENPFPPIVIDVQETWAVECGAEVAVEAEATGGDLLFTWQTENGFMVDNDETLNWVVTENVNFILQVQDACGQLQLATVSIATDCTPPSEELCAYVDLGEGAMIPDDQTTCFILETEVALGDSTAIVSDASDISFFVNMEHSYMGDLTITYTCPNGQSLQVVEQGGYGTNLGVPDQVDGLGPGLGWQYYWSPNATNGTWAENGQIGGGSLPPGVYESAQPFSLLEGCPVDGVWQIEICDLWAADDGYLFAWGIDFGDCSGETGCTNPEACNYNPVAVFNDGSCALPGCMDSEACNFDPNAGCDDQSCLPYDTEAGCMDQSACNFNPEALCSDESCVYPLIGNDCNGGAIACGGFTVWDAPNQICVCEGGIVDDNCPSDLNGNGFIEVTDLMLLLSDFGSECPPE